MVKKYTAVVIGHGEYIADFDTITEAQRYAEEYGDTANDCKIYRNSDARVVARHCRDISGDGRRWFKASIG